MDTQTECDDARSSLIRGHPILTTADDGRGEVLMAAPVARVGRRDGGTAKSEGQEPDELREEGVKGSRLSLSTVSEEKGRSRTK